MKVKVYDTIYNVNATEQVIKTLRIYDFDTGANIYSLITAKGSLLVGTADGALAELVVGTNTQVLTGDSTTATGLKWAASSDQGGASLTNKSGTTAPTGTVVKLYTSIASCFTTTTTESDIAVFGVTAEDIADSTEGRVLVNGGVGTVLVTGTVAIGDRLASSTTATRAIAQKINSFATALTANASGNGTVTAILDKITVPNTVTIWADEVVTTVTIVRDFLNAGYPYATYTYNTAANAADGDEYRYYFSLAAGTYTLYELGIAISTNGKLDLSIDGVSIATGQDWYAASTASATKTVASVVVPTSGNHVLLLKVNGKHASSTDYSVYLTKIWFTPA